MPIVQKSPHLRFEFTYSGTITVLEGEELARLNSRFFWHYRRQLKRHSEPMTAFLVSVVLAYQGLYGKDIVDQAELRDLTTADSRKMDLFYRGMYLILCETLYPDEDWEKLLYEKASFGEFLNEATILKPNFVGLDVDTSAIVRGRLPRKLRTREDADHGA